MADLLPLSSGPDPAVMEAIERGNAVVFMDVALGEGDDAVPLGRIKLELFVKDVRPVRPYNRMDAVSVWRLAASILTHDNAL
jgi:hypothetical protein